MSRDIQLSLLGWERGSPGIWWVESRDATKHGATSHNREFSGPKCEECPGLSNPSEKERERDLVSGVCGLSSLVVREVMKVEEGRLSSNFFFFFPSQLMIRIFLFTRCFHKFSEKFPFPLLFSRCVNSLFLVTKTTLSL